MTDPRGLCLQLRAVVVWTIIAIVLVAVFWQPLLPIWLALPKWLKCGFRFIPAGYSDLKPATVPI